MPQDITRRGFLELTGAMSMPLLQSSGFEWDEQAVGLGDDVEGFGLLLGPAAQRPAADSEYFEQWDTFNFVYFATDTGERAWIQTDDTAWETLNVNLPDYAAADLPTDASDSQIYFDTNRGIPAWFDQDHYEYPSFTDDVLVEPVTVANTTQRTEVFDAGINEHSLVKGRTYQLDLMGKFSTANNSAEFTVEINLDEATDLAGIGNVGGNSTDAPWSVEFTFTVREDGTNGTIAAHSRGLFNSEAADSHHDPITVDTTAQTKFTVDLLWNEADPGNTATLGQAHLKEMG